MVLSSWGGRKRAEERGRRARTHGGAGVVEGVFGGIDEALLLLEVVAVVWAGGEHGGRGPEQRRTRDHCRHLESIPSAQLPYPALSLSLPSTATLAQEPRLRPTARPKLAQYSTAKAFFWDE
jgi:hypothetical protein